MRTILFVVLALLVTATTALAGDATVEWTWNDETMGKSDFHHDFGVKKWNYLRVVVESKSPSYHVESSANWVLYVLLDGKTFDQMAAEISAGDKYERRLPIKGNWDAPLQNLTVDGYIYNTGVNTGRIWVYVYAEYTK
jgi:hypothetical protein